MKSFSFRLLGAVVAVGVIAGSAQAANIYHGVGNSSCPVGCCDCSRCVRNRRV